MEDLKKCNTLGHHTYCFYLVKIRPSQEEREKEEAEKQYHFMTLARSRINEEIDHQKGNEHQIQKNLMSFAHLDKRMEWKMSEIKNLERYTIKPSVPLNSRSRTSGGFLQLPARDAQTTIRPDRRRCHKRLIKKGKMDTEYLQQVEEDLLSSKKCGTMTSFRTQELNDLIECTTQMIQHGDNNRADELKIYKEVIKLKETKEICNAPDQLKPHTHWYSGKPWSSHWYSGKRWSSRDTDWQRSIQHTINIRLDDIENIQRAQRGRKAKVTRLKADLEFARKKISILEKELEIVNTQRIEAYERARELGDQKKETKSRYSEYQSFMTHVKELARKGDVAELKRVCDTQVEGFIRQWQDDNTFRDDYIQKSKKLV